jgi:hypothetical protein
MIEIALLLIIPAIQIKNCQAVHERVVKIVFGMPLF